MEAVVFEALQRYFNSLYNVGHIDDIQTLKLLILTYINDLIVNDYNGCLKQCDSVIIERALEYLSSSTCIIPYIEHKDMIDLHIGEFEEIRKVIDEINNRIEEHDNIIDNHGTTIEALKNTKVVKVGGIEVPDIEIS